MNKKRRKERVTLSRGISPRKVIEREYFFPECQKSVMASNIDEATRKINKLIKQ